MVQSRGALGSPHATGYNEETFRPTQWAERASTEGAAAMMNSEERGPRPLAEILSALFAARGLGRIRAVSELEAAWNTAVGEPISRQTRVGSVRRGVLNVTVAHSALLQELAAFRKPELLAALGRDAPSSAVHDIRFRIGPVGHSPAGPEEPPTGSQPRRPTRRDNA
jgi:predicted nucleic acid-binding Zn ribbon protein